MTLTELAQKYSVDKLYNHSYIPFYEEAFAGRNVQRLLEIGIGHQDLMQPLVPEYIHGASLKMWEEYFPTAQIFSCDIRPETLINEGRIHSYLCDQYDAKALGEMLEQIFTQFGGKEFDVIIDDGCHTTLAQVVSFMVLWRWVAPNGIYIIEDVGYPDVLSKAINGDVHIFRKNNRWDDVLVTRRKSTTVERFFNNTRFTLQHSALKE